MSKLRIRIYLDGKRLNEQVVNDITKNTEFEAVRLSEIVKDEIHRAAHINEEVFTEWGDNPFPVEIEVDRL